MLTLEHSDALEIFCRVVKKYEMDPETKGADKTLKDKEYTSLDFLLQATKNYSQSTFCARVGNIIFDEEIKKNKVKGSSKFYTMVKQIRELKHISINDTDLDYYLEYINDGAFTQSLSHYKNHVAQEWKPSTSQFQFQDTMWWLYYYDIEKDVKAGVSRAILSFESFGRAKIFNFNTDTGMQETYIGKFIMVNKEELIKLEMKLEGVDKDLHLLFYIGTGNKSNVVFSVGQFHNFHSQIYSGVVVISKQLNSKRDVILNKIKKEGILTEEVKFFSKDGKPDDITKNIWDFLNHKKHNLIEVPCRTIKETQLDSLDRLRDKEPD